jgi:hypothetical protein
VGGRGLESVARGDPLPNTTLHKILQNVAKCQQHYVPSGRQVVCLNMRKLIRGKKRAGFCPGDLWVTVLRNFSCFAKQIRKEYSTNVLGSVMKNISVLAFLFTPVGTPPNPRFVFDTQSFSWPPRSGDCEGCRIRSWDCCVGSLDLLASAISTEPPQPPTEPPQPQLSHHNPRLSHHNPQLSHHNPNWATTSPDWATTTPAQLVFLSFGFPVINTTWFQ